MSRGTGHRRSPVSSARSARSPAGTAPSSARDRIARCVDVVSFDLPRRLTNATSITVRVPLRIRRQPGRKTIVTPVRDCGDAVISTRADPALVKALARAFRYQRLLDEGKYASITEMAAAEKIDRGYLGSLLRLTLLAPDMVELILDGRAPDRVVLPALLEPVPLVWAQQREHLVSSEQTRRAELGVAARPQIAA